MTKRPSLLDRVFQRPVAVKLRFGPRAEGDLAEALTRIGEVLRSDNEFCDDLKTPAAQVWTQFESRAQPRISSLSRVISGEPPHQLLHPRDREISVLGRESAVRRRWG